MQIINELIKCSEISWQIADGRQVHFTIARLDEIHPVISGNKYFKLKYNLQQAITEKKAGILTMGGAFSNHLCAAAFACKQAGIKSTGIIRGEITHPLNSTLSFCKEHGMELVAVDRNEYSRNSNTLQKLIYEYADYFFVPEGGDNENGVKGCKEILSHIPDVQKYTHIVCCIGTGTTFKGILRAAGQHQTVIGIPVLKIKQEDREYFIKSNTSIAAEAKSTLFFDFAGRGYAKADDELIHLMNQFYEKNRVKTDFVYTGKLVKAVISLFEQGYFQPHHPVLVLHTGGLQGNNSLAAKILSY